MKRSRKNSRGFTLVEVLATLVLMGIVLPVAMRGISIALAAADTARHTSEATSLAEEKLNELVTSGTWSSGGSGDFGTAWPGYSWTAQTADQPYNLTQLTLTVAWNQRGGPRSLSLTTFVSNLSSSTSSGATP
jgi:prepilin-type N-terminal cleavage/methylation domain-containing protein